jgi:hypothetical protein
MPSSAGATLSAAGSTLSFNRRKRAFRRYRVIPNRRSVIFCLLKSALASVFPVLRQ